MSRTDFSSRALALFAIGALTAGALVAQPESPPAPVRVVSAVRRAMAPRLIVPGSVVSRSDARIAAETSGRLVRVAEVGEAVARGGELARIDDEALRLQLKDDEADIKRLEANLAYLDQQVTRQKRLTEQQVAPANDLDDVLSRRESAEQELVQARVAREQTLFRLERSRVLAPFAGRVAERLQQPGGYVAVGGELVRLVDTARVEIMARAPVSVAPHLADGMIVSLREGAREASGRIRTVVPVGDQSSRMFEIRVVPEEGDWLIGSAVRVALPSAAPREVIAVPRDALILRRDSTYVFKVTADDTAERVEVETGIGEGDLVEVTGPVEAGDRVVVRGGERLRAGQAVSIAD